MQTIILLTSFILPVPCFIHAVVRSYPYQFIAIILGVPVVGPLAYLSSELVPDIYHSHFRHHVRKVQRLLLERD
jgi:hypothetical protein